MAASIEDSPTAFGGRNDVATGNGVDEMWGNLPSSSDSAPAVTAYGTIPRDAYPPILFIIGLVSFVKGIFNR